MPKAKSADRRLCAVPMCSESVPAGKLMCREHWHAVPRDVQRRVNHASKGVRGQGTAEYRCKALAEYRAAVSDAVATVKATLV